MTKDVAHFFLLICTFLIYLLKPVCSFYYAIYFLDYKPYLEFLDIIPKSKLLRQVPDLELKLLKDSIFKLAVLIRSCAYVFP